MKLREVKRPKFSLSVSSEPGCTRFEGHQRPSSYPRFYTAFTDREEKPDSHFLSAGKWCQ